MGEESIQVIALSATAFFIALAGFIIYFVILYRNKQLINKQEQEQLKSKYDQELLKAQIEIQEETLNNVSREIHDNISQVLSFIKLNLAMAVNAGETEKQLKINESREQIANAINDLRDLSKSLSFEHITLLGLARTIQNETDRVNKSGLLEVTLSLKGSPFSLGDQREVVLFRIFQESLNNTLKHASAKHFNIILEYLNDLFNLTIEDDGVGFDTATINLSGAGLNNIKSRAALIGAVANIKSLPGRGCCITIGLNLTEQQLYINGNHSNRFG